MTDASALPQLLHFKATHRAPLPIVKAAIAEVKFGVEESTVR